MHFSNNSNSFFCSYFAGRVLNKYFFCKTVRRKKAKPLGQEKPPWDAEGKRHLKKKQPPQKSSLLDFQPIVDLVGAAPSPAATSGFNFSMSEPQRMFPTDTSGLEYILVPQPPSHVSRVQLRGSTKPLWFPGTTH